MSFTHLFAQQQDSSPFFFFWDYCFGFVILYYNMKYREPHNMYRDRGWHEIKVRVKLGMSWLHGTHHKITAQLGLHILDLFIWACNFACRHICHSLSGPWNGKKKTGETCWLKVLRASKQQLKKKERKRYHKTQRSTNFSHLRSLNRRIFTSFAWLNNCYNSFIIKMAVD